MEPIVYINGQYLPVSGATVSVMDRGFLLADGVYEVVPIFKGKPFHLDDHLQRLHYSLDGIGLSIAASDKDLIAILHALVDKNDPVQQQIFYLQITRGIVLKRSHTYTSYDPTIFAKLQSVEKRNFTSGVKVITFADIRWNRCDIKSINRLSNVMMAQQAMEHDAEEALILQDDILLEGATSNVFVVADGVVSTPPISHEMLAGVTRSVVMDICRSRYKMKEQVITTAQLLAADEVLLTSSSRGVVPVTQIDDMTIGSGVPGPIYQIIAADYEKHFNDMCDTIHPE